MDELIHNFKVGLEKKYGRSGLVKIALEPGQFEQVCAEFYTRKDFMGKYINSFSFRDRGEFFIEGVQIVAREPREF